MPAPRGKGGGARGGSSRGRGKTKPSRCRRVATEDEVKRRNEDMDNRQEGDEEGEEEDSEEENEEKDDGRQSNANEATVESAGDGKRKVALEDDSSEEDSEKEETSKMTVTYNPNRGSPVAPERRGAPDLTRRQKEQLARDERDRKIDALRAAGKTEQSRADLARLADVRARREAERLKKEAELTKKNEEEVARISQKMGGLSSLSGAAIKAGGRKPSDASTPCPKLKNSERS